MQSSARPAIWAFLFLQTGVVLQLPEGVLIGQIHAALLVDLNDLDPDHVADVDHILALLHTAVGELGDVDHAVLAGGELHESAKGQDADHLAVVELAHLGDKDDGLNGLLGGVNVAHGAPRGIQLHVGGAGADGAVVDEVSLVGGLGLVANGQTGGLRSGGSLVAGGDLLALVGGGLREVVGVDAVVGAGVPHAGRMIHHVDVVVGLDLVGDVGGAVVLGDDSVAGAVALDINNDALGVLEVVDVLREGGADVVDGGVALDAVYVAGDVGAVSNLRGVQSVEGVQSSLLTTQSGVVGAVEVAGEQVHLVGDQSGVDAPAAAGELALHAEADGAKQHLRPLEAGQSAGGLVSGRGHAVDDALLNAEGNVAGGPAGSGDVVERGDGALQAVGLALAQQHVGNDLGGLLTGVVALRLESRLGHAVDDTDADQDAYRLLIRGANLLVVVREVLDLILSRGAHDAQTENHGDHEHEAQGLLESSHNGNSSFE